MLVGQFSLNGQSQDNQGSAIRRLLEQLRDRFVAEYRTRSGYACGIRSVATGWMMEMTCGSPYDRRVVCVTLGPTWLTCDVTGERIRTGRKEWPEMGVFGRAWYCILSVVYAAIIGFFGVLMTFAAVQPTAVAETARPVLFGVLVLFVAIGLGIQFARIRSSRRRAGAIVLTHRAARKCFSGQIGVLLGMVILGVIVACASKWIGPDGK